MKRAKGDVKKSGIPDPYAYVPLSTKLGSKRGGGSFKDIMGKPKEAFTNSKRSKANKKHHK